MELTDRERPLPFGVRALELANARLIPVIPTD